jgi:CheY-like chemotaxis protein
MDKIECTLLIDDDQTTNFVNQMLLEDLQVSKQVLVAHNGKEALELISRQCENGCCPELILLDINMPVMNGFEFLKAYEKLEFAHKQSVVIVMLTTSMNPEDVKRLEEFPTQGLLTKPLTSEMVQRLLKQHFNRELPG